MEGGRDSSKKGTSKSRREHLKFEIRASACAIDEPSGWQIREAVWTY
jgi:hypothetical protein